MEVMRQERESLFNNWKATRPSPSATQQVDRPSGCGMSHHLSEWDVNGENPMPHARRATSAYFTLLNSSSTIL